MNIVNSANKSRIYALALAALALGIIFDYLFFEKFIGISVFIFEAVAVLLTLWFSARFQQTFRPALWLIVLALFFVAMVGIHANLFLAFLNIVASAGLLLLAAKELLKKPIVNFRIPDYALTILFTPFKILRRFLQALSFLTTPSQKSSAVTVRRVIVGILLALPFLLIFGALFASADLAFKQLVDSIFRFQISENVFAQIVLIAGVFVVSLGVFSYLFNIPPEKDSAEAAAIPKPEKEAVERSIEVKVFLWLIAGLFAIFLVFQIAYLFGGAINISQGNFTYAEYARKGFWELLTVAFFTLVILLIMDRYTKHNRSRTTWFTAPSLVLTAEIFIIIISAFKRLLLYQSAYGLTTLRLYVLGFIILLGAVFILLAIKLWREKEDRFFAFGALLCMIAFLAVFNLLNPDVFIARKNIHHFDRTGKIDARYLGNMSADAVPTILNVYDRLNPEDKMIIQQLIGVKKTELEKQQTHWQSYNVSRYEALKEINSKSIEAEE